MTQPLVQHPSSPPATVAVFPIPFDRLSARLGAGGVRAGR